MGKQPQTSLAFLERFCRGFPDDTFVSVSAIPQEGGPPVTVSAPADDVAQLAPFIDKHAGDNLYFAPNPVSRKLSKKATKADVAYVVCAHVDVDPDKAKPLAAERKRIERTLRDFKPEPAVIIDSGGGYQAFWPLADPVHVNGNATELEALNKKIEAALGGDHCANIDRIMRLPGTTNFPNAKKRAAGRKEAPTKLVRFTDKVYAPGEFEHLLAEPASAAAADDTVVLTRKIHIHDVDVDTLNVSPAIKQLIKTGHSPEKPYRSGSEALFAACAALRQAGYVDDVLYSVVLDKRNDISAHAWKKGDGKEAQRSVDLILDKLAHEVPVARVATEQLQQLTAALTMPSTTFAKRRLKPREYAVDVLLPTPSIVWIFGAKSVGKTMFALTMLGAVANGDSPFLAFKVPKARRCLFVDGEMPAVQLQERLRLLFGDRVPELLEIMSSEDVYHAIGGSLNIFDAQHQAALLRVLDELDAAGRRPAVIAFDNLSTLTRGFEENSNDDAKELSQFFIKLRHLGYAVVVVHHLGKSGDQRGGIGKLDPGDIDIKLSELPQPRGTAAFMFEIGHCRDLRPKPDRFTCELRRSPQTGRLGWHVEDMPMPAGWQTTLAAIKHFAPSTQADLARALTVHRGTVIRHLKTMRDRGLLDAKSLTLTSGGDAYLAKLEEAHGEFRVQTTMVTAKEG